MQKSTTLDIRGIQVAAAVVRGLSVDAVEASGTGHPGMPMGNAELGVTLYGEVLRHLPANPRWIDRDRFVLSAGHGSVLLYALLHLSGYDLSLDEIGRLRRLGSKTPGHPEYGLTAGVETTTGPLGAGFATAVGMAIAETRLAEEFNRPGYPVIDHWTYALSGDGCLMEGVTAEAASLAGHLGLGKLIVFYDANSVSIEGNTSITFTEDVLGRFQSYRWQTLSGSAHDPQGILDLVDEAKSDRTRPTLIRLESVIGKGSPGMQGSHTVHGAKLGPDEIARTKAALGLPPQESFYVDPRSTAYFAARREIAHERYREWEALYGEWSDRFPELKAKLGRYLDPAGVDLTAVDFPTYPVGESRSTRDVGGEVIRAVAAATPNFLGGSADLSHSNKSEIPGHGDYTRGRRLGKTIRFGVREHAMASIQNGILLHGGFRTFAATLFVFIDYMRPAMRLAALMKIPAIYVLTHDSIYLGGDGPTHQPIEHLNSLRIIPNMRVFRPAGPEEAVECWKIALERTDGPTCLVMSRQGLTLHATLDDHRREKMRRLGAYRLRDPEGEADVTVLATGSEVDLAVEAAESLKAINVRIVSVPSREMLAAAPTAERTALIGDKVPVVAVEAGSRCGWERFTGGDPDRVLGIDSFGESGRGDEVAAHLGLTAERLAEIVRTAATEG